MKAHLRNVRISPKKVNLVADLVRKMNAEKAIAILNYTPKKAARILSKLVASAVANAKNNQGKDTSNLMIAEVKVSKGLTIKRFNPISRGRAHPINKFCSHIHVILKEENAQPEKAEVKSPAKTAKKAETKKTVEKKAPAKKATAKKATAKKAPAKKAAAKKDSAK